jgi:mono/diheme cytochrome c family protein
MPEVTVAKQTKVLSLCAALMISAVVMVRFGNSARAASAAVAGQTGAALFQQKCAGCHGKGGSGNPMWKDKGQPDFNSPDYQKSRSDQQISDVIHNGKGKYMPAFKGKLTEDQISSLVGQVRAFGKK